MRLSAVGACTLLGLLVGCGSAPPQPAPAYQPTWESLVTHEAPEWLIDAKFGIYAHWGVYSVPAFGNEWYAQRMYNQDHRRNSNPDENVYEFHRQKYGDPSEFGYKDLIPEFKAENFDAAQYADLIRRSGARYAGIAVVHHDGFLLWDSAVNRWNSANMGPKRDLYGELVEALRAIDMKVIATFHHIRTFNWYLPTDPAEVQKGKQAGWDIFDPEYSDLYWNEHVAKKEDFVAEWRTKVTEVIDKYSPDLVWFDGGAFQEEASEKDVQQLLAYYYNQAAEQGREVDVLNKLPTSMKFNFPRDFGVLTYEAGRDRPDSVDRPWIDDEKIGLTSWGYIEGLEYRDANELIDALCDRVARGGGMLLSLSPMADGTIPQGQQDLLLAIGGWLEQNGDAIYETRRWKIEAEGAEGKFRNDSGDHRTWRFVDADATDIRFTRKGDTLYALAMEWPADGKLRIKSLAEGPEIASISMLGGSGALVWSRDAEALTIELPDEKPNEFAYAIKVEVEGSL